MTISRCLILSFQYFLIYIHYTFRRANLLMTSNTCFGTGNYSPFGSKVKTNDEYEIYSQRKKGVKLPKNMEKFFRLLQDISKIGYSKALKKRNAEEIENLTNNFFKTFDRLSSSQKKHYLLELIIEADRRISDRDDQHLEKTLTLDTHSVAQTMKDPQKYMEQKGKYCFENQKTLGLIKNWNEGILKLNKLKKRLTVKHKNSLFHLPLRSYILRSKKQEMTFALQSTHEFQEKNLRTIFFELKNIDKQKYTEFYRSIFDIIVSYQIDKLMMQNFFNEKFDKIDDAKRHKIRLYLSESTIKNCVDKVQQFQTKSRHQKTYERIVLKDQFEKNQNLMINQYKNVEGTWYKAQTQINDRHEPRLINFLQIYHHSHKYLAKFNILETYAEECQNEDVKCFNEEDTKYCAFYQKVKIQQKLYGQEIFLQKIKRKEQNEQVFYFVNLDYNYNQNFINFLKVTLSPAGKNSQTHFCLTVLAKFNEAYFQDKHNQTHFLEFLSDFYFMFERLRCATVPENAQVSIQEINSKFFIEKDLISRFQADESPMDFIKKNATPSSINMFIKRLSVIDLPQYAYLRRRHRAQPTSQKIGKFMKEHFLYKEWERLPKGGLKCTNYDLVAFQKSLYKAVIKKFGENLLKGRNIINFSLPVVCFKKESHLQSLAQSMCYCPIHLEKAAKIKDPLERMKYSVVIMIAVGILTVQSEKPFNPILGETYQGYVDGCPLYIEQISHHPPISAYYLVGRGYKMYGCVEPRISLHFNGATGFSNLPHFIQYDDGTIVELIFAKITITGMMFGDRQFFFEDKIYAFDKTNKLFAELIFGPFKSGGIFSSSSEPADYFHGKIYEVTDKFKTEFEKSNPRIYPSKADIIKEHVMFDGIWSGSVHVDGQEIINFKTDLPYEFVQEEYPLPSDSRYRKDLQKLVQGDKQQAQRIKQLMEEDQRKDKKLRGEKE